MKVDDIIWTTPRDRVPVLLQGRVSLAIWQSTFDAVQARYEYVLNSISYLHLIPCFICCTMSHMVHVVKKNRDEWTIIARQQADIYRPFGIQVTLAKELTGIGSSRQTETVGLRFDVATQTTPEGGTTLRDSMARSESDDMVAKLERLQQLHQTGALTESEYTAAKAKLLST
jgi:Short C-terminal domain